MSPALPFDRQARSGDAPSGHLPPRISLNRLSPEKLVDQAVAETLTDHSAPSKADASSTRVAAELDYERATVHSVG
ncbi:MAG TPA: hypothetical protein VFO16_22895 [Pseudonocardiaceae bacterium]|nr:hypothetical protein [Pseudonocardiaceae bacterium]